MIAMKVRMQLAAALGAGALALAVGAATAVPAAAAPGPSCSGDLSNIPASVGVLAGTYTGNVRIGGACAVVAGPTVINGNLTVQAGSTLLAAFASGSLTVNGNVLVQDGGTLILGCIPTSFPCFDDQGEVPSLSSHGSVSGNLVATQPLGVIVHNTDIGGSVTETGGGGGVNCGPPDGPPLPGIFGVIGFPVYSDYEDNSIGGNLNVIGLQTCWLGMARDQVGGSMVVVGNQLADPDGAEVISNTIAGSLVCHQNSMVWDSADLSDNLYPRLWEPNTVNGQRVGQCVAAPPIDGPGGVSPGAF
jgi:hypothetical protein